MEIKTRIMRALAIILTISMFVPFGAKAAGSSNASDLTSVRTTEIDFPGLNPGLADAIADESGFTVSNDVLSFRWNKNGDSYSLVSISDKLNGDDIAIKTRNNFVLTMSDGTVITDKNMSVTSATVITSIIADTGAYRLADREHGKEVKTTYRYDSNGLVFELNWSIILRNSSNYVKQKYEFIPISGDLRMSRAKLETFEIPNPRLEGEDKNGTPIVAGNIFMGLESPMADNAVSGNLVGMDMKRSKPVKLGSTLALTTSIGVVPEGQMKRGFRYYLERERVHYRRPLLQYNSWWDLPGRISEEAFSSEVRLFGDELVNKRNLNIDSYNFDDGWDNVNGDVWSFNSNVLPNEFKNLAQLTQSYGGNMGTWLSPMGGYGSTKDARIAANWGRYEINSDNLFSLSGTNYYNRFKNVIFDMIDTQGVKFLKFDGIGGGLYQTGPAEQYYGDYEALMDLLTEIRQHEPEIYINCTVGTWGSPYWLFYADSIWRDGQDMGYTGQGSYGFDRQKLATYRDANVYSNMVRQGVLMPITSLMTDGIIFSQQTGDFGITNTDLDYPSVRKDVAQDMKAFFGLGTSLQDLYVQGNLLDDGSEGATFYWDELAKNSKWAKQNLHVLSDNQWVGGDPQKGEVYGTASWSENKAILMLRNPSWNIKYFSIDPQQVFNLPSGAEQDYKFVERDGWREDLYISAGQPLNFKLNPFEVVLYEVTPTSKPFPTITPKVYNSIPKSGWSLVSVDSQASGYEATKAFDGNVNTIWHTAYSGASSLDYFPHDIVIDLGASYDLNGFRYTPRQDGGVNGTIAGYELYVSEDMNNWGSAVKKDAFDPTVEAKDVSFDLKRGRYIKFVARSEIQGLPDRNLNNNMTSVAEIDLYTN